MHGLEKAQIIKEKLSQIHTGANNHFFGKTHTEEAKQAINKNRIGKTYEEIYGKEKAQEILQKRSGVNNSRFNKKLSEEHKQKLLKARIKIYNNIKLQSPSGEIYTKIENLTEFCRQHNIDRRKLALVLNGQRIHHKNWRLLSNNH